MEGAKLFQQHTLLIIILVIFMLISSSESTAYTVGDDDTWRSGIDYLAWAQKYNFTVGDALVFEYIEGAHNVYEVTDEAYQSCNATSGVNAKYETGSDTIELEKPKQYWFICNIKGHCLSGMKFTINVSSNSTSTTSLSPSGTNHYTVPSTYFAALLIVIYLLS